MKKEFGTVHAMAECKDCSWEATDYKNAQGIAATHAEKFKHKVYVEIGLAGYYEG